MLSVFIFRVAHVSVNKPRKRIGKAKRIRPALRFVVMRIERVSISRLNRQERKLEKLPSANRVKVEVLAVVLVLDYRHGRLFRVREALIRANSWEIANVHSKSNFYTTLTFSLLKSPRIVCRVDPFRL